MPDLKEVRVSHPAMSFITGDTFATPHSQHVSSPKAIGELSGITERLRARSKVELEKRFKS